MHVYLVLESEKIGLVPENAGYAGLRGEDADVGARITEVVAKSPAEEAGLKQGDIVFAVDGTTILSYRELQTAIDKHVTGDKVKLGISRERKSVELEITLGKYPEPKPPRRPDRPMSPEEQLRHAASTPAASGANARTWNKVPRRTNSAVFTSRRMAA